MMLTFSLFAGFGDEEEFCDVLKETPQILDQLEARRVEFER